MDFGGGGLTPVTFLDEKSWKITTVLDDFKYYEIICTKYTKSSIRTSCDFQFLSFTKSKKGFNTVDHKFFSEN